MRCLSVLALLAAGCSGGGPPAKHGVVSLAPSMTEVVFALGKGEELVGVTTADDHPPEAMTKPKLMGYRVNFDAIVRAGPALVLADLTVNDPGEVKRLRDLGLAVADYEPVSVRATVAMIRDVGRRLGAPQKAEGIVSPWERWPKAVHGPRVMFTLGKDGLYVAGTRTLASDIVRAAGGVPVIASERKYAQANVEQMLKADPQVIFTTGEPKEFLADPVWSGCAAVRAKAVFHVDGSLFSRAGPRLGQAYEQVRRPLAAYVAYR